MQSVKSDEDEQERVVPSDIRDALNISLGIRQSQLRRITGSIAYHLASIFGFQLQHADKGDMVLSSVANQVEHVVSLLANRMDTYPDFTFMEALRASVASLHQKVCLARPSRPPPRLRHLLPRQPPPPCIHPRASARHRSSVTSSTGSTTLACPRV